MKIIYFGFVISKIKKNVKCRLLCKEFVFTKENNLSKTAKKAYNMLKLS